MHEDLDRLYRGMARHLEGLDAERTQLRSGGDPARWSMQQIVEHLLLTYQASATVFEKRLAKGRPTRATPTLRQRFGQFVLITLGRFPAGREAPAMVMPAAHPEAKSGSELIAEVAAMLARFDVKAAEAERLFGTRRAVSHQVLGPLSVGQWRRFHLVHGEHHLRQIAAIRRL